jgi:hypothetical protein
VSFIIAFHNPWTTGRELELHPIQLFICLRDFRRSLHFPGKLSAPCAENIGSTYLPSSCRIRRFSVFITNLSRCFLLDGENCYFVASEMRCRRLFHSNVALFGHNVALLYVLLSRSKLSSNFSDLLNVGSKIVAKYKSRRMPLSNSQS